jgi:DNA-directed RNA polymerase subunit M/transcription elongation factor TFIIS
MAPGGDGRLGFVIRLKCNNCGQMMKARREYAGRKGRCPNCKSVVTVPEPVVARTAGNQSAIVAAAGDSHQEASRTSPATGLTKEDAENARLRETGRCATGISVLRTTIQGSLTPSYDEVSLFLMSVTTVLVFIWNPGVRQRSVDLVFSAPGVFLAGVYVIMYGCGLVLCVYHIFSSRQKNDVEKYLMLFFAVLTNGISGICAGVYVFRHSILWLAVLPIWNIISGAVLILMLWFEIIDRQCVSDQDATIVQAIIGLATVLAVFFVCTSLLKLHWAITFSICVAYSTSLDRAIRRIYH